MKKDRKSKSFLDKPFYQGGNKSLRAFVDAHLVYPDSVLKEGIKGTVVIKYTINHKGSVIETKVLSGIGHGCDEAAEAVVKQLKFEVGTYRNIKVLFHKTIKIHFHAKRAKKKATAPVPKQTSTSPNYTITPTQSAKSANKGSQKLETNSSYYYTIKFNR